MCSMQENGWIKANDLGEQLKIEISLENLARSNSVFIQLIKQYMNSETDSVNSIVSVIGGMATSYQTPHKPSETIRGCEED